MTGDTQKRGQGPAGGPLEPVDRLLLWALGALGLTVATLAGTISTFQGRAGRFLAVFAALALFLWASARLAPRSKAGDALHAFAPLAVVIGIFQTVGFVVAVANSARWDAYFAAMDHRLFGGWVDAWRGALGRPAWFTDLLSVFYVSYYVVPVAMGVALYARGRREEFDRLTFGLQATLLSSYVLYFLFPTAGPRVPIEQAPAVLGGGAVSEGVRWFLHTCEMNAFDAFPSGHTAVSLVFLAYGWRMFPRWRVPLAVTAGGIVFSTVYLSHHYVVDIVAGAALALGLLAAMPWVHRAFGVRLRAQGVTKLDTIGRIG